MSVYVECFDDLELIERHMFSDDKTELNRLGGELALEECVDIQEKERHYTCFLVPMEVVRVAADLGAIRVSQEQYRAMRFRFRITGKFGKPEEAVNWMSQYLEARYRRTGRPYDGMVAKRVRG